jgi:hypothetical protein
MVMEDPHFVSFFFMSFMRGLASAACRATANISDYVVNLWLQIRFGPQVSDNNDISDGVRVRTSTLCTAFRNRVSKVGSQAHLQGFNCDIYYHHWHGIHGPFKSLICCICTKTDIYTHRRPKIQPQTPT